MYRTINVLSGCALALLLAAGSAAAQGGPPVASPLPEHEVMRFVLSSLDDHPLPQEYVRHTVSLLANALTGVDDDHAWTREVYLMLRPDGGIRFDQLAAEGDSIAGRLEERLRRAAANGAFTPLPCTGCDSLAIAISIVHRAPPPTPAPAAYFEFQVEQPVHQRSTVFKPEYPASLLGTQTTGRVLVQFVVGVDGKAEMSTFRVLESTHPSFTEAVRKALPGITYAPAEIGGKKVRQVVQQPFTFEIPQPASSRPEELHRP